jgi:hypothetical protein
VDERGGLKLRERFLAGLQVTTVSPPPVRPAEKPTGDVVTLRDWRNQIAEARKASLKDAGIYFDASPTGAGKSYADGCALEGGVNGCIVLPTHVNCAEAEIDLQERGVDAVAYPARLNENVAIPCPRCNTARGRDCVHCCGAGVIEKEANCWNAQDADDAQQMGLNVLAAVCPFCPHEHRCKNSGYLAAIMVADAATVIIATHARGMATSLKKVASGRDYLSVHESAVELLRPHAVINEGDIEAARNVLVHIHNSQWLNYFGNGREAGIRKAKRRSTRGDKRKTKSPEQSYATLHGVRASGHLRTSFEVSSPICGNTREWA